MNEAVRLDSGFLEAHIELGAFHAEAGRADLALEHFDRALELDSNSGPAYTAKASALVMLNRAEDAERAARRAVQLDPASIAAHYMLGTALWMQQKITVETAAHLRIASDKYPLAREYLAAVQERLTYDVKAPR